MRKGQEIIKNWIVRGHKKTRNAGGKAQGKESRQRRYFKATDDLAKKTQNSTFLKKNQSKGGKKPKKKKQ